jgi:diguanylate cyclase (GGDEF)-like protein/PAS domain S-box-containing protein
MMGRISLLLVLLLTCTTIAAKATDEDGLFAVAAPIEPVQVDQVQTNAHAIPTVTPPAEVAPAPEKSMEAPPPSANEAPKTTGINPWAPYPMAISTLLLASVLIALALAIHNRILVRRQSLLSKSLTRTQRQQRLNRLISVTTAGLLDTPSAETGTAIERILRVSCEQIGADRAWLVLLSNRRRQVGECYEWRADGVEPRWRPEQEYPSTVPLWWAQQLTENGSISLSEGQQPGTLGAVMPAAASPARSLLALRLQKTDGFFGFIGWESETRRTPWSKDTIECLKMLADMVGSVLVRRQVEQALRHSRRKYQRLVEDIGPLTMLYSHRPDGLLTYVSPAIRDIMGQKPRDVVGRRFEDIADWLPGSLATFNDMLRDLLAGRLPHCNLEVSFRHPDGSVRTLHAISHIVRDKDGNISHLEGTATDITDKSAYQKQLEHLAHYDPLTGLANRLLLADRLQQAMLQSKRRGKPLAVAYLDLDGFKQVNDTHGHEVGDKMLIAVAGQMAHALRSADTVARLGGDEFVVVLTDWSGDIAGGKVIERLQQACSTPIYHGRHELRVSASIGITVYPQTAEIDADQLLRQADQAMYQAKQAGRNRSHVFGLGQVVPFPLAAA